MYPLTLLRGKLLYFLSLRISQQNYMASGHRISNCPIQSRSGLMLHQQTHLKYGVDRQPACLAKTVRARRCMLNYHLNPLDSSRFTIIKSYT